MNLGLGIETALTPTGSVDGGATAGAGAPGAAASNSKANPAAAVFGQLMAKALQQQAKGQAGTGQATAQVGQVTGDKDADAAALLAMLGVTTESDPAQSEGDASAETLTDQSAAAQGLPLWMPPLEGMPAVQQITVGPSLKAITGTTALPDANSLAAFARQQGLDTAAIAWLMNPAARGGSDLPVPGASAATPAALTLAPSVTAPTLPSASGNPGSALASTLLGTANALSATLGNPQASTAIGSSGAVNTDGLTTASAALAHSAAKLLPEGTPAGAQIGAAGPGGLLQPTSLSLETTAPGGPPALGSPTGELSHLRWSQAIAAAQANPQNPAGAAVNMPATSTAWAEISLDLSGDAGEPDGSDESADNASQGGLSNPASASPLTGDGHGLHKAQALSFQARLAAQPGLASNLAQGSDQMQQLSEKMADAIGERMLRELEKGEMNLRLSLKPAHLGHIEVEMRLRAGELDATFSAPQAATRELLQDGLTRLRDSLAQAGMDVANLNVKNGQNRQNGGDSTPGQRQFSNNAKDNAAGDAPVLSLESAPRPRRADGWDVMV